MAIIYKHTNTLNGKSYIGQTVKTLEERCEEISKMNKGRHTGKTWEEIHGVEGAKKMREKRKKTAEDKRNQTK